MSRRRTADKRIILPDPTFNSVLLSKFINIIMIHGKKAVAEKIVYDALHFITDKSKKDGIATFNRAIDAIKPAVELKSRRVGGANYQIPVEVSEDRQLALAMRWLRDAARKRSEKSMFNRLAGEILDIVDGRGATLKKKEDIHKMAEANRAFAHFRY